MHISMRAWPFELQILSFRLQMATLLCLSVELLSLYISYCTRAPWDVGLDNVPWFIAELQDWTDHRQVQIPFVHLDVA